MTTGGHSVYPDRTRGVAAVTGPHQVNFLALRNAGLKKRGARSAIKAGCPKNDITLEVWLWAGAATGCLTSRKGVPPWLRSNPRLLMLMLEVAFVFVAC